MPGSGARAEGESVMGASVRLSRKTAIFLRQLLTEFGSGQELVRFGPGLDAALAPKRHVKAHAKVKRAKKRDKNKETSIIYAEVEQRAAGKCECGCGVSFHAEDSLYAPELDHAFGRGKAKQSVRTCWMLTARCHRRKTNGVPSEAHWLDGFAQHCDRHGYTAEAALARSKIPMAQLREVKHHG